MKRYCNDDCFHKMVACKEVKFGYNILVFHKISSLSVYPGLFLAFLVIIKF